MFTDTPKQAELSQDAWYDWGATTVDEALFVTILRPNTDFDFVFYSFSQVKYMPFLYISL